MCVCVPAGQIAWNICWMGLSLQTNWLDPRRQNELASFRVAGSLYLSAEDHLARVTLVYSLLLMHFPVFFNTDLQY